MVADHPLLSSAGTDNEAQGEVTERTDSRFPLRHDSQPVSYTHLRAHETDSYLVCRLLLEKKKNKTQKKKRENKKKKKKIKA